MEGGARPTVWPMGREGLGSELLPPGPSLASRRGAGWAGGRKEGLGGLRAGNLQRARARAFSPYVRADAVSYDPAILQPRVTHRAAAGRARGRVRVVALDEWWTPDSTSSVCGFMELRVEVHAGAVGSDRGRGILKRPVGLVRRRRPGEASGWIAFAAALSPSPANGPLIALFNRRLHQPARSKITGRLVTPPRVGNRLNE